MNYYSDPNDAYLDDAPQRGTDEYLDDSVEYSDDLDQGGDYHDPCWDAVDEDPCIAVEAQNISLYDIIESHDGNKHIVEGWHELPSKAIVLSVAVQGAPGGLRESAYRRYNCTFRPTALIRIVQ